MEKSGFTATYERIIFLTVRDAVLAAEEDKRKRQHPIPDVSISSGVAVPFTELQPYDRLYCFVSCFFFNKMMTAH